MAELLHLQNAILEMVATGSPLDVTMGRLCRDVEAELPEVVCSVLRIDRAGLLHPLAAPSLPASYCSALDGLSIGPEVGSCGTAAYYRVPVAVPDIARDPKWHGYADLALSLGLRACWSSPICGEDGRVLGTFAFYYRERRGPTEEEKAVVTTCLHLCMIALERHERALESDRLANNDALTGLANRARFNRVLSALPCGDPGAWALLVIDVDNLKVTNDTFGHPAGDELLKEVAARMARTVELDLVFRLGGDEFAIIVHNPSGHDDIEAVAERILAALDEPVICDGHLIQPRATIGGAILSAEDGTADSVRQKADFALYHAKETGRGGFVRYWPGIGTAITRRLSAIKNVNEALRDGRIHAYYQPLIDLDTGKIVGAEALCRLVTEEGNILSASEFHEATSDAHVACALTDRMLSQIVLDLRRWLDLGIRFEHIGLNVSYADIHRGMLGDRLASTFAGAGIPLNLLVVEITENVYIGRRDHVIADEVAAMRALGIRVALDDFGTGFASLTHLLTVPVDIIKIDKSFVAKPQPGAPSGVIVDGLLTIAQKLGIGVIAEGIEHPLQLAQLQAYGGTLGQGYLFSRAVDAHAMTALLQQRVPFSWQKAGPAAA
ncbi:putative bifunctional diguanylate cyclase/phosphodiesterase [Sphingomonas soli]|uniref:putative bifunctional diguanylate cyclase/phosphodiesterase n=1 Tax=Sphingomonas soli TaxID=266127 RepID=UPI0008376857|nr:EAL domain-containing protein [Sphingomonas soli]